MGVDRPEQDRDGVGFVVVGGTKPAGAYGFDHGVFVGIALAGDVTLDRPNRYAFVRDAVLLAPCREGRKETAVQMGGICADVPADFFEVDRLDARYIGRNAGKPATKAQVTHAAAVVTARAERC